MKPIIVEQVFDSLFDTIPQYEDNHKLSFGYGEQKELNALLLTKQLNGNPCYPLLWYNLPNDLEGDNQYVEGMFDFVLATTTQLDWFNDQRFKYNFKEILYPHFSLVLQALSKANSITLFDISGNNKYRYTNYPNYGNPTTFEGKDEQKQVDIWDAIKFTVKLRVYGNCDFTNINYNLNNLK